jgi:hypothetical protein
MAALPKGKLYDKLERVLEGYMVPGKRGFSP